MTSGAVITRDQRYRYALFRRWSETNERCVLWVMLNPSTADEDVDDPTIRRCIGFSKRWGYGQLRVVNLFALRATNPRMLEHAGFPGAVGPENDEWITTQLVPAAIVIAAWGHRGGLFHRDCAVQQLLTPWRYMVHHLGLTRARLSATSLVRASVDGPAAVGRLPMNAREPRKTPGRYPTVGQLAAVGVRPIEWGVLKCDRCGTSWWTLERAGEPLEPGVLALPARVQRVTPPRWVELRALELGTWFRFVAFPDQVAQLVEKGPGRALIRYARRDPETRTFEARARNGQKVTRTLTVKQAELEPCALGAQVVPIVAGPLQRIVRALEPIPIRQVRDGFRAPGEVLDGLRGIDAGYRELLRTPR